MQSPKDFPYTFNNNSCKTCRGNCCRVGGYVWVSTDELEIIATSLNMDPALFAKEYLRKVYSRLSLQERYLDGEYICCFFDPIDCFCRIYQNRPQQCKTFPFWNQFKRNPQKLLAECPGVSLI